MLDVEVRERQTERNLARADTVVAVVFAGASRQTFIVTEARRTQVIKIGFPLQDLHNLKKLRIISETGERHSLVLSPTDFSIGLITKFGDRRVANSLLGISRVNNGLENEVNDAKNSSRN